MRRYYNHRMGSTDRATYNFHEVIQEVLEAFKDLDEQGYFQRSFGYNCVDSGRTPGLHGAMDKYFYRQTGIRLEGGPFGFIRDADEIRLFTIIEFLHDHAAAPDPKQRWGGRYHDFSNCGWHFEPKMHPFDIAAGQKEWRTRINNVIDLYGDGYELSEQGEIVRLAPDGLADLIQAEPPPGEPAPNVDRIARAVRMFRRGRSTREEQKQAIADLYAVLEYYRPRVKREFLKKDEDALFMIANNYAIRHHNELQKDDYRDAWLSWLFFLYLSSVHLMLALIHGTSITLPADLPPPPTSDEPAPGNYDPNDDIPF